MKDGWEEIKGQVNDNKYMDSYRSCDLNTPVHHFPSSEGGKGFMRDA